MDNQCNDVKKSGLMDGNEENRNWSEMLYGNELDHALQAVHEQRDSAELKECKNELETVKNKLCDVQSQLDKALSQNKILLRNLSCVFVTAQREIQRKDTQLEDLQRQLDNSSNSTSKNSLLHSGSKRRKESI